MKDLRREFCAILALALALTALSAGSASAAPVGAILVHQPAYDGMSFYVYQPVGIPGGWYVTYDSYPVCRGRDGVWLYGAVNGTVITPTACVVGSVLPSAVGLVPWGGVVPTAAVMLPSPCAPAAVIPGPFAAMAGVPVPAVVPQPVVAPVCEPAHPVPATFLAIGGWRGSVDRVGVLRKPAIPVAWLGRRPQVIYAWTGLAWRQLNVREGDSPLAVLRNNAYDLARAANREGAGWNNSDTALLIRCAAAWGYGWMGQIPLERF
ncbi:hypothetical protein FF3_01170 [Fretibacterium fastidiosum]|uniref:hypothetical protein n=1 Tax=Fretibacterium fastidiosum TaxID=651822 RepID=UPI0038FC894F